MKRLKYWGKDYVGYETAKLIAGYHERAISKASGVRLRTIRRLRLPVSKGGTRYPSLSSIRRILRSVGYDLWIMPLK